MFIAYLQSYTTAIAPLNLLFIPNIDTFKFDENVFRHRFRLSTSKRIRILFYPTLHSIAHVITIPRQLLFNLTYFAHMFYQQR